MKKILVLAGVVVLAGGAWAAYHWRDSLFGKRWAPGEIRGPLNVLTMAPQGEEIPISADGLTVMFDHPVIPLTTLDQGKSKAIPLEISPKLDGTFHWLGTRGFIFRPKNPFDPATSYRVTLPGGLVSVDGYRLDKEITWSFQTVRPRVRGMEPSPNPWQRDQKPLLLPTKAAIRVQFNVAMKPGDVEKALAVRDDGNGQLLLMKREFVWEDGNHVLTVRFKEELPWDSQIRVTVPAGLHAATGDLGTLEDEEIVYETPAREMKIDAVRLPPIYDQEETALVPGKEIEAITESSVCYRFSQPIVTKSFQKAFHVESASKKPATPYYYFMGQELFPTLEKDSFGVPVDLEGYTEACAAFLDDYQEHYSFWIDPSKIESLSGVKLAAKKDAYSLKTGAASPFLTSNLTKSILSLEGPMKIPYRAMNLDSVTLRLYRLPEKSVYSESVKGDALTRESHWEPALRQHVLNEPPAARFGKLSVPVDTEAHAIDTVKMPPETVQEIPVKGDPDKSAVFWVDLKSLPQDHSLKPGFYLVEVLGHPAATVSRKEKKVGVYSMIQVTSVGLAYKVETDHVVAWATDIESGQPVSGLPLQMTSYKYDGTLMNTEEAATNNDGVAIFPSSSDLEAVTYCLESILPGREGYTCNDDHQVTDYRERQERREHNYFAYLYTDRPVYRPGQKVFFSSFIREVREGRYLMPDPETGFDVVVRDAAGTEFFKQEKMKLEPGGILRGEFQLEEAQTLPRGEYDIAITADAQTFNKSFFVLSYRKPSFKVDVKTPVPELVSRNPLNVDVTGTYFFGAPLRKAPASWSIMTSTYIFQPENFPDFDFVDDDLLFHRSGTGDDEGMGYVSEYEFDRLTGSDEVTARETEDQWDDPRGRGAVRGNHSFYRDPQGKNVRAPGVSLSEQGELKIRYTPDLQKYPTSQRLTVEANVEDPSHQEVSGAEDVIVHKASYYLGIRPEKWVYGEKEKAAFQVVSLDTKGQPAPGKSYTAEFYRREYKYIERRNAGGFWEFLYQPEDKKVAEQSGATDPQGKAGLSFQIPSGGTYRVVLKGSDEKKNVIQSDAEIWAWGEGFIPWKLSGPEKIELVPDKDSYKVGETARILVKSLVPVTKALLTYERGRVLDYRVIELGKSPHLEIPITEGMRPNLFIDVIAHAGRVDGHPPLLFSGETEIHVEPESKRLQIQLATDRIPLGESLSVYRPGDTVKVHVETKDAEGRPRKTHLMVSVADESVLRLLDYQLPDLIKKFYYRRPNNVQTSSSLMSLKAGDGGPSSSKLRRIFKDTAHFEGHLVTNDQGQADFSFKLPDDLTTWVIEALAVTDSKTAKDYEAERASTTAQRPSGQTALGTDLILADNTFVGGNRLKFMTTLPVTVRTALPRFAAWGDVFHGKIILNNQNPEPQEGKVFLRVEGDGILEDGKMVAELPFSLKPKSESVLPVVLKAQSGTGKMSLAVEARSKNGETLDGLVTSLPVMDRYQPEVVATSGQTKDTAQESIDIPKEITPEKGGLGVSFKASLGLAVAGPMRNLIYFPWGCSEQKSATLLGLLIARDLSDHFGEKYFDSLAPVTREDLAGTTTYEDKLKVMDGKINGIIHELDEKYRSGDGGMKYWPESVEASYFASVQVLWAYVMAEKLGFDVSFPGKKWLESYVLTEMRKPGMSLDNKAYGLRVLSLAGGWDDGTMNDINADRGKLSVSGMAYFLMALKNHGASDTWAVAQRLLGFAKQEPRHTSWPESGFFWSSQVKNTALAAHALYLNNHEDPMAARAMNFLLNRKRTGNNFSTQDDLALAALALDYIHGSGEDATDFKAKATVGDKEAATASFDRDNLLSIQETALPMKEIRSVPMPADLKVEKQGSGMLYYDLVLKYYLPPELTPPREEGLIISRDYYDLNDAKEEKPLTKFTAGENYKGHIVLVVPDGMNYVLIEEPLPAGFEPIDMKLATSSRAAALLASQHEDASEEDALDAMRAYDDVISVEDYAMDYGFQHQEIRDDSIVWSDEFLPPGTYHLRYPVRATTAGSYLMSGATAFEFYEPEIFGRSRAKVIEIKEGL